MRLDKVDWYSVYKIWIRNSGAFECFFKSSPFVTAKYMNSFELNTNKSFDIPEGLKNLLKANITDDKILFVDVNTNLGIKIAVSLNNDLRTPPILTYNFLFHPYGIVGNNELLENLVCASEVLVPVNPITYAFILDFNRYDEGLDLDNTKIFNNQYEITDEEVPSVENLQRLNKKSVVFLYMNKIKEDIFCYLEYLRENNFNVSTIDLGELLNE
jgi:hypothetical protein